MKKQVANNIIEKIKKIEQEIEDIETRRTLGFQIDIGTLASKQIRLEQLKGNFKPKKKEKKKKNK